MPESGKRKYRIKRIIRFVFRILMAIFGLLLVISLLLNIPAVQTYLTGHAGSYLEKKLNPEINIRSVKIALPKTVVIRGIYVEDRNKDTLLYLETLRINVALLKLIRHRMDIENLSLENLTGRVFRRLPDNRFNFNLLSMLLHQRIPYPKTLLIKNENPGRYLPGRSF